MWPAVSLLTSLGLIFFVKWASHLPCTHYEVLLRLDKIYKIEGNMIIVVSQMLIFWEWNHKPALIVNFFPIWGEYFPFTLALHMVNWRLRLCLNAGFPPKLFILTDDAFLDLCALETVKVTEVVFTFGGRERRRVRTQCAHSVLPPCGVWA